MHAKTTMYNPETLTKYASKIREMMNEYMQKNVSEIKMSISKGNQKIGKCLNISLPALLYCHNCDKCKEICYEIKNLRFDSILDARARNAVILELDRDEFFHRIHVVMSRRRKNKYIRFHVSGDIPDYDYFCRMIELVKAHPDFIAWTYTKHYGIVNRYVREHGGNRETAIPANFSIMFSVWNAQDSNGNWFELPILNPYDFPTFVCIMNGMQWKENVWKCPGNCDVCKQQKRGCIVGENSQCGAH